jgi:hypothetical protein
MITELPLGDDPVCDDCLRAFAVRFFSGAKAQMASSTVVTYVRVSTSRQGRSGLGIEAQRQTLRQFAMAEGLELGREFVEVETGKGSDALDRKPQLKAALAAAKKLKCAVQSPS